MAMAREGTITTRDGRRLAYLESGDPQGPVVVAHHGTPGCRYPLFPDPSVADGLRLLTYDRPGYGGSAPNPGRAVADAAADVEALADALEVERFGTLGFSGGGPHALACAALLPGRVARAAVLVGVAPIDDPAFDFTDGMAEMNVRDFEVARTRPEEYRDFLRPDVEQLKADSEGFLEVVLAQSPPPDRAALTNPAARELMLRSFREAIVQDEEGLLEDGLAFARSWGFALETIAAEVRVWQGELDTLVPRAHGAYIASKIPGARSELVPGEGHMIFGRLREALAWAAGLDG